MDVSFIQGNKLFSYRTCSGEQQRGAEFSFQLGAGLRCLLYGQQTLFGELLQQFQCGKKYKVSCPYAGTPNRVQEKNGTPLSVR